MLFGNKGNQMREASLAARSFPLLFWLGNLILMAWITIHER